jgi:uncharacterized protein (TIGR00251 family)
MVRPTHTVPSAALGCLKLVHMAISRNDEYADWWSGFRKEFTISGMGRISLKVVPGSSRNEVVGWLGDSLKVKVKAPPEKGRANEAVIALLADRLGDASSIAVVSGHGSPSKVVAVDGMDDEAIRQAFSAKRPGKAGA